LRAPYTLDKAALIALTKHIAIEYGRYNIRACTLALGNIATEKRWGKLEVPKVAACLASCNFSFTKGNTIVIDCGTVLL
jgi:3-oxoacyl-[acyl-carrier protein] reductase